MILNQGRTSLDLAGEELASGACFTIHFGRGGTDSRETAGGVRTGKETHRLEFNSREVRKRKKPNGVGRCTGWYSHDIRIWRK